MHLPFRFSLISALLLAACDTIPRDPDKTLELVRESGVIRLGEVEGAAPDAKSEAALARLARATGARVERVRGHGEELLEGLEEGKLDLVYGRFADDSPWAAHVFFGTPPGGPDTPPGSLRMPRFAFKLGENGWITAVEEAGQ